MMTNNLSPKTNEQTTTSERRGTRRSTDDRREHDRHAYRTVATIVATEIKEDGSFITFKGWTHDISAGGARLITTRELPNKKIYLQLLLPGSGNFFIEAEICNSFKTIDDSIINKGEEQFSYGVRFLDFIKDKILLAQLESAKATFPSTSQSSSKEVASLTR